MSIFKDKNPERTTILEILVHIFSLLPETLEELFKKINEFKNLKNQTLGVKFKKGGKATTDTLNKIITNFLERYKKKKRSMSGTYVVNLFNSIEKFENVTDDNILEVYEEFIKNCENIVSAKNIPEKALFGPENKKFHKNLKEITTGARTKLDALKSESKNQTSKLRENLENEKKKTERLTKENSTINQQLETEKNKNKSLTKEKSVIEDKLGEATKKVRDLTEEKETLQNKFTGEQEKNKLLEKEKSDLNTQLTSEKAETARLQKEKEKYAREKEEEQKKLKQELEQKFDTERSDLTRRADEATTRSMALESALRISAERNSEKQRLDYLKNGDLNVFTSDNLDSSSSRLVNEISGDDLSCLKGLELKGFTYNLENLNFSGSVERLLRDFYSEAQNCLGMDYYQGELAKKLLSIADLLNPEIPYILRDKTGWGVKHLEHLRMKLKDLKMYLDQLSMIDSDDETLKNLTALRAWCFEVNSLAKKIKDFLITLDIEKNDSYDYDYYEDEYEYEGNEDEQDISDYSDEE